MEDMEPPHLHASGLFPLWDRCGWIWPRWGLKGASQSRQHKAEGRGEALDTDLCPRGLRRGCPGTAQDSPEGKPETTLTRNTGRTLG